MAERENACSRSHGSVEPRSWNVGWPAFGSGLLPGSDYGRQPSGNGSRRMILPRPWREIGRGSQRRNRGAGRQELRVHRERSRRDLRAIRGPSTSSFCPCRAWRIGRFPLRCAARSPISSQPPLANQVASKMPTSKSARAGCTSDVRIEWPAPSPAGVFRTQFAKSGHAQS
jgi:hypothetical protein